MMADSSKHLREAQEAVSVANSTVSRGHSSIDFNPRRPQLRRYPSASPLALALPLTLALALPLTLALALALTLTLTLPPLRARSTR